MCPKLSRVAALFACFMMQFGCDIIMLYFRQTSNALTINLKFLEIELKQGNISAKKVCALIQITQRGLRQVFQQNIQNYKNEVCQGFQIYTINVNGGL